MGIMKWVKERVEKKGFGYYASFLLLGLATAVVTVAGICSSVTYSSKEQGIIHVDFACLWYFLFSFSLFVIFCLWLYYSPIVCQYWALLETAFPGHGYWKLYRRCQYWLCQCTFVRPGRSWIFKGTYIFTWVLFILCYLILTIGTLGGIHHACVVICSIVLTSVVVLLNFSSCYICIIFVYFLIRIYKLERDEGLDYIKQFPSATKGFQMLNRFASVVYLYFLLDSLFSTISYYAFWRIIKNYHTFWEIIKSNSSSLDLKVGSDWCLWWAFLYSAAFLIIFGLVTWGFIILVSRTYIHRLHSDWKLRSFQAYEKEYYKKRSQQEQIAAAMEELTNDKISMNRWEMLISLVTLAANLVTARSIFSS